MGVRGSVPWWVAARPRAEVKRILAALYLLAFAWPHAAFSGDLEDALDEPLLAWTTGGDQPWGAQTNVTSDGIDACQPGVIGPSEDSWIETSVSGPGTLSFWWKSASPGAPASLSFESGDVGQDATITGLTGWRQRAVSVPEGDHVLRWRYASSIYTVAEDTAYLDRVTWVPGQTLYCINGAGVGGTVTADPSGELYAPGSEVALNATPDAGNAFIGWAGDGSGNENPLHITVESSLEIEALFGSTNTPDAATVEATNLVFCTGGDVPWESQASVTHDGEDAARCGWLTAGQESWMTAEVTGPGVLSFWWKASYYSVGQGGDRAEFFVGRDVYGEIGSEEDWCQHVVEFGEGTHRLMWRFSKQWDGWSGDNRIWVDQVSWYPGNWRVLTVDEGGGTVEINPGGVELEPGVLRFEEGSEIAMTAVPPPGQRFIRWSGDASGSDNPLQITMDANKGVIAVFGQSDPAIEAALDNADLAFTVGGDAPWVAETSVTHDGEDAAQSGGIAAHERSWIETTVSGPGVLTFWWKVSCEDTSWKQLGPYHSDFSGDALQLLIDGNLRTKISGEVGWGEQFIVLSAGDHTIRWQYAKDLDGDFGQDAAWLDGVSFVPGVPLDEALDVADVTWRTSTSPGWIGQTVEAWDGQDAAASELIQPGQTAWIETEIDGPKFVRYALRPSGGSGGFAMPLFTVSGQTNGGGFFLPTDQWWPEGWVYVGPGHHTLRWSFENHSEAQAPATALLDAIEFRDGISIGEALDAPDWSWQTNSGGQWMAEFSVSHDREDAVQVPTQGTSGTRWLQTTVDGPGILGFWYLLGTSWDNSGRFTVFLDGVTNAVVSGTSAATWKWQGIPIAPGTHTIRWVPSGGTSGSFGYLDETTCLPMSVLADAIEAPDLPWSTGGASTWYPQTNAAVVGGDAARSGAIAASQQSYMEATITGPSVLQFWWKVSSEPGGDIPILNPGDTFRFLVDGTAVKQIAGEVDWRQETIPLCTGDHIVRWEYVKDPDGDVGQDAAWLDGVQILPPVPLGDALDAPELGWTTGGRGEWIGQSAVSLDGLDSAECAFSFATPSGPGDPFILFPSEVWIQTEVTGPGRITFRFKPKGEQWLPWNATSFQIQGAASSALSVAGDWNTYVFDVPSGQRTLRWACPTGNEGGWLDQVVWRTDVMYSHWLARHFTPDEIANPAIGGFHTDPDGDGLPNGLESAMGTNPRLHDSPPAGTPVSYALPPSPGASDRLRLAFDRAEDSPYDVTLWVQVSSSLEPASWTTIAQKTGRNPWAGTASVGEDSPVAGRVRVTVHDTVPAGNYTKRFMRVVASQTAP